MTTPKNGLFSETDDVLNATFEDLEGPADEADAAAEAMEFAALPPRTALGDRWRLGAHTLVVGDCTDPANLPAPDRPVDLLNTDPPYGVGAVGGTRDSRLPKFQSGRTIVGDAANDDATLLDLLTRALSAAVASMKPGAAFYIWHANMKARIFLAAMDAAFIAPRQVLIWVKPHFVFGRADYHWRHEPCFYGWKEGAHVWHGNRKQSTVWAVDGGGAVVKDHLAKRHPSAKPVELAARAIRNSCPPGGLVFDPFAGSGSTLMAAEAWGYVCHACEIDPHYADLILYRWELATGKAAIKENNG